MSRARRTAGLVLGTMLVGAVVGLDLLALALWLIGD